MTRFGCFFSLCLCFVVWNDYRWIEEEEEDAIVSRRERSREREREVGADSTPADAGVSFFSARTTLESATSRLCISFFFPSSVPHCLGLWVFLFWQQQKKRRRKRKMAKFGTQRQDEATERNDSGTFRVRSFGLEDLFLGFELNRNRVADRERHRRRTEERRRRERHVRREKKMSMTLS